MVFCTPQTLQDNWCMLQIFFFPPLFSFLWAMTSFRVSLLIIQHGWAEGGCLPASLVLANHFGEGWRSRYGIKYFCQNRFWSGFLAAWIWPAWIKHEDDMGNAACSLWDSRDCPPRRHLAPLTVLITMTLAFMKDSTHFRKSARLPPPPLVKVPFLRRREIFYFLFFHKTLNRSFLCTNLCQM